MGRLGKLAFGARVSPEHGHDGLATESQARRTGRSCCAAPEAGSVDPFQAREGIEHAPHSDARYRRMSSRCGVHRSGLCVARSVSQEQVVARVRDRSPVPVAAVETTRGTLARTLLALGKQLDVHKKLTAYRAALRATESQGGKSAAYFLLVLLPDQQQLQIKSFSRNQAEEAYREYEMYERILPLNPVGGQFSLFSDLSDYSGAQAVLVGADSLRSIRESYPNYYLDTAVFLDKVEKFTRRYRRAV